MCTSTVTYYLKETAHESVVEGVRQNSCLTPKSPERDFQKVLFLLSLGFGVIKKRIFSLLEFYRTPVVDQIFGGVRKIF